MRRRVLVLVLACAAVPAVAPGTAHADTEDSRDEAKRLFVQGSSELLAKHYAEALEHLRASYKLVPSPNSGLLIARCLRELGRRVEAVEMYSTVTVDARRRAADGDAKYGQTADVAAAEGAAVRATIGLVHVRLPQAGAGSTIEIDGVARPATDVDVVVLHLPGEVTVKFKPRTGPEQSQRATLAAGGELRMEFTSAPASAESPPLPPPPPRAAVSTPDTSGDPPAWTLPAALVAGGVTLAGAGIFVGFGLRSRSTYDELYARCGPSGCGASERAQADEGQRDQTIANVGLAVGIAGAVATFAFLLVRAYGPRSATPSR